MPLFISAITVMELELGVLQIERKDSRQGKVLRRWLEADVLATFDGRVLSIDTAVARRCAQLQVPDPRARHGLTSPEFHQPRTSDIRVASR
jgi:predicted nucleic acid-binding protein